MPKNTRHWPGEEHKIKLPGLEVKILCAGVQFQKDSPQKWYEEVFSIIRDRFPRPRCSVQLHRRACPLRAQE